jgi:flagellar FliJ protein
MAINLQSLQIVIDLATRKRDDAGREVAGALQDLNQAQAQMQQLQSYAAEGEQRWQQRASAGVSPALLHHQQQFALRIQHALDFQAGVIAQKQSTLAQTQTALQAAERELATLNKVAERTRQAQALLQQKAEQKRNDEMAMNMLAHQKRQKPEART